MTRPQPIDSSIEERFAEQRTRLASMSFPNALAVGNRAPHFELPNAQGRPIRLADQLERGPVVLTFYRGAWCPFCNVQLRGLQEALPEIETLGASLLAISPQLPDGSRAIIDKHGLTFEVLSDLNSVVASTYGITFTLPRTDQALFLEVGNDLRKANGDSSWVLPAPSTFVVTTDGTIHHARVDPDYTNRITTGEILSALRTISTNDRTMRREGRDDGHDRTDRPTDGESRED
jgi:peroxiredoxin